MVEVMAAQGASESAILLSPFVPKSVTRAIFNITATLVCRSAVRCTTADQQRWCPG